MPAKNTTERVRSEARPYRVEVKRIIQFDPYADPHREHGQTIIYAEVHRGASSAGLICLSRHGWLPQPGQVWQPSPSTITRVQFLLARCYA